MTTHRIALDGKWTRGAISRIEPVIARACPPGWEYVPHTEYPTGADVLLAPAVDGVMPGTVTRAEGRGAPPVLAIPSPPARSPGGTSHVLRAIPWYVARAVEVVEQGVSTAPEVHARPDPSVVLASCRAAGRVCVDVETFAPMHSEGHRVAVVGLAVDPRVVWVVDLDYDPSAREWLREIMADPQIEKIGWNVKFDAQALAYDLGIERVYPTADAMLLAKLLDVDAPGSLASHAPRVWRAETKDEGKAAVEVAVKQIRAARRLLAAEEAKGQGGGLWAQEARSREEVAEVLIPDPDLRAAALSETEPEAYAYALADRETIVRYCAGDVSTTLQLYDLDLRRLAGEDEGMRRLWDEVVRPAAHAFARMESWGLGVDEDALDTLDEHVRGRVAEILLSFTDYPHLNPRSPASVAKVLFGDLGLTPTKRTAKGAPSVDAEVLETLAETHWLPRALLDLREVDKIQGTYVDGMRRYIRAGRIHPSFRIAGTATGRASCASPNLQTIPSSGPLAKTVKGVFAAAPGYTLLQFDYSQIELRVAAVLSGDPEMVRIYREGRDYHGETAAMIARPAYGVDWRPPAECETPEERQRMGEIRRAAKIVNFGLLYGMGDDMLAKRTNATSAQAAQMREAVFGRLRRLAAWIEEQRKAAVRDGYARSYWRGLPARRRLLYAASDPQHPDHGTHTRSAWNTPIQGTASDFCLRSIVRLVEWIEGDYVDARLVLTVHDSLVLEVRDAYVDEAIRAVAVIMTDFHVGEVPIVADCERGRTWGSLSPEDLSEYR